MFVIKRQRKIRQKDEKLELSGKFTAVIFLKPYYKKIEDPILNVTCFILKKKKQIIANYLEFSLKLYKKTGLHLLYSVTVKVIVL